MGETACRSCGTPLPVEDQYVDAYLHCDGCKAAKRTPFGIPDGTLVLPRARA